MSIRHAAEDPGVELFSTIARGVITLAGWNQLAAINLPYPRSVQLALDRVILRCLEHGQTPPTGVPHLINWCANLVVSDWPFAVPSEFVGPDARLIDPETRMPTRTCAELASYGPSGVVEQDALALLDEVASSAPSPALFQDRRDFLIQRTVVTRDDQLRLMGEDPAAALAWRRLSHLYAPVSLAYLDTENKITLCPTCGLLALPAKNGAVNGTAWCESESCPRDVPITVRHSPDGAVILHPSLRIFLAIAGKTELLVREQLRDLGVGISFVAGGFGAHRLDFPDDDPAVMWVHDRIQPALLAARVAEDMAPCPLRKLIVVPERCLPTQPDYRSTFSRAFPPGSDVALMTDRELISSARSSAQSKVEVPDA